MQSLLYTELREKIKNIPALPGCYLWYGVSTLEDIATDKTAKTTEEKSMQAKQSQQDKEEILYVGKAVKLQNRLRSYLNSHDTKTRFLMQKVTRVDWIVTDNEMEALLLESNLIKKHNPVYNIRLKDDKRYPYLCLTLGEDFPRLIITRRKQNPKHAYFGPFADVKAARNTVAVAHRVFPIRKRNLKLPLKKPARPCLNYFIKRCWAPCAHKTTKEEYSKIIENVYNFLQGQDEQVSQEIHRQMTNYSQKLEYEKAAQMKEILQDIQVLRAEQKVHGESPHSNYDVVGLFVSDYLSLQKELDIDSDYLDYISVDRSDSIGQIVLLRVRNGNLISKKSYAMSEYGKEHEAKKDADSAAEIQNNYMEENSPNIGMEFLSAFFRDYYLEVFDIPERILVPEISAETRRWQKLLNQVLARKTNSVNLKQTQILGRAQVMQEEQAHEQSSLSLLDIASTNAKLTLRERVLNEKLRNQRLALRQLQNLLSLPEPPNIIECYDISNIQGTNSVGSGVILKDGIPYKSGYRRYQIRDFNGADDPGMIHQVIYRRLSAIAEKREKKPNLMVIDGGITQLGAALRARQETGVFVPMIGLAKKEEELYLESGEVLDPDSESPAMLLLRLARDEAHRFGVSYHRTLRKKQALSSSWLQLAGVGEKRKLLLQEFFSKHVGQNFNSPEELSKLLQQEISLPQKLAKAAAICYLQERQKS